MTVRKISVISLAGAGLMLAGCASGHAGGTPAAGGSSHPAGTPASQAAAGSTAATGNAATAVATATASSVHGQRPEPLWLQSVRMASASNGWALALRENPASAESGPVLLVRTGNGGRTWADVTPAGARAMLATPDAAPVLDVADAEHAYLAVSVAAQDKTASRNPTAVFATTDGGHDWSASAPFTVSGAAVQVTFADASHGWLLLDAGSDASGHPLPWLYRTTDGRHWAPAVSAAPPGSGGMNNMCQKLGLAFPSTAAGWLRVSCRSGDFLVQSRDGGSTWQPQSLPLTGDCTAPGAQCTVVGPQLSGGTAFVTVAPMTAAPAPSLLASSDLGQAWQQIALPSGAGQYPQVSFFTAADGVLVAAGSQQALGAVFFTTDNGGRSWSPVPQGRHFTQLGASVDFANPRDGVEWTQAGDAQGSTPPALYATTDSGRTWISFVPVLIG